MLPPLLPLLASATAQAPDSTLVHLVALTPHLMAVGLVLVGLGVGLVLGTWCLRLWRERLLGRALGAAPASGVSGSLRTHQSSAMGCSPELDAMPPAERRFTLEILAPLHAPGDDERLRPRSNGVGPAEPRTGIFACPACGAQIVCTLAAPHHATSCLRCGRRITLRSEPSGVVVEADEEGP